jgi:multimeric flavodoxin WrbA
MRVLGIAGSPRHGGNTDILLAEVMRGAASCGAEVKTIFIRELDIAPCQNCEACFQAGICKIHDDMQLVYKELALADRIALASPLHFMGLTAQTKAMVDRGQSLWARKYKLHLPPLGDNRIRKGLFISVGGQKFPDLFNPAIASVKAFFISLDIIYAGELFFSGIDKAGDIGNIPGALEEAYMAGRKLAED